MIFYRNYVFFQSNVKVEGPLFLPGSIDLVGREGKRPRWGERRKAPGLLYINSKYSPDILWRTRHSPNSSDEVIFSYIMLLLSHGHFMQEIFIFKVHMSDQICVCFSNVNPLCSSFSFISLWSLLNPVRSNWSKEFNSPNIGGFYFLSNTDDRYYISGYIHLLNFPVQIFKSEHIIVCTLRAPKICTY